MLLDCCSTAARLLLDCCSTAARLLLDCCSTPARLLLDCCRFTSTVDLTLRHDNDLFYPATDASSLRPAGQLPAVSLEVGALLSCALHVYMPSSAHSVGVTRSLVVTAFQLFVIFLLRTLLCRERHLRYNVS